jgi:hypothetical protein
LLCSVVREAGEVEVGERPTREKVASQHLANRLDIEPEAGDTELSTEEESEEESEAQGKKVSPTRQRGLGRCQRNLVDDQVTEILTLIEYRQMTPITKLMINTMPHHQIGTSLYLLRRTSL